MNKQATINILSQTKKDYKEFCKKQFFCNTCQYSTTTNDKIDCFEKFYLAKLDNYFNK